MRGALVPKEFDGGRSNNDCLAKDLINQVDIKGADRRINDGCGGDGGSSLGGGKRGVW